MIDRRLVQHFDWGLLGVVFAIGAVGLLTLYSAVTAEASGPQKMLFYKQMIWFAAGLVIMLGSPSLRRTALAGTVEAPTAFP